MVLGGFGGGVILGNQEFINPVLSTRGPEKIKLFDPVSLISGLPSWLIQMMITLFTVWIGLWAVRYVVKWMIQPKQWSHRPDPRAIPLRQEHRETLRSLITSPVNLIALAVAGLVALAHFIGWTNVTLLTGALGLASTPLIRNLQSGLHIVFEDVFDLGEQVQISTMTTQIEGIVEGINVRTTSIRAFEANFM